MFSDEPHKEKLHLSWYALTKLVRRGWAFWTKNLFDAVVNDELVSGLKVAYVVAVVVEVERVEEFGYYGQ